MTENIKRLFSILLLVIFLIPSVGIMLYMRHCNSSGKTSIALENSGCCSKHGNTTFNSYCNHSDNSIAGKQILKRMQCCDNSNIYVKLDNHLAVEKLLLTSLLPALIVSQISKLIETAVSDTNAGICDQIVYPPWENAFIKYCSLRL
ncbi:MAG TPA: hypothetical protein VK212_08500 [Lentimicrobium sp.]|nr:hypothetical protein [Lentimicrobium sp.]